MSVTMSQFKKISDFGAQGTLNFSIPSGGYKVGEVMSVIGSSSGRGTSSVLHVNRSAIPSIDSLEIWLAQNALPMGQSKLVHDAMILSSMWNITSFESEMAMLERMATRSAVVVKTLSDQNEKLRRVYRDHLFTAKTAIERVYNFYTSAGLMEDTVKNLSDGDHQKIQAMRTVYLTDISICAKDISKNLTEDMHESTVENAVFHQQMVRSLIQRLDTLSIVINYFEQHGHTPITTEKHRSFLIKRKIGKLIVSLLANNKKLESEKTLINKLIMCHARSEGYLETCGEFPAELLLSMMSRTPYDSNSVACMKTIIDNLEKEIRNVSAQHN